MESNRCKKHRGAGSPSLTPEASPSESCHYINARGHRCRILVSIGSTLCAHHARLAQHQENLAGGAASEALAAELLASIEDFSSPAAVNLFLGNLVKQMVRKRISRPDAVALAYLSQLLLNSLSSMNREQRDNQERDARRPPTIIFDGIFSPSFAEKTGAAPSTTETRAEMARP